MFRSAHSGTSLMAQTIENLPATQETWVRSLGREDPVAKRMAIHASILGWKIPWTEKPGGLQSSGLQRATNVRACTHTHTHTHTHGGGPPPPRLPRTSPLPALKASGPVSREPPGVPRKPRRQQNLLPRASYGNKDNTAGAKGLAFQLCFWKTRRKGEI